MPWHGGSCGAAVRPGRGDPIPPATGAWHDNAVTPLPYDVQRENQLLDAAGYAKGANGVRQADGHDMAYDLLVSPDVAGGLRMGQILTQSFAQIGVTVVLHT